jgi:hypothetical protein
MEDFIFSLLIIRDPFEKNVKNNFRGPFENCQEYAPPRNSKGVAYSLRISIQGGTLGVGFSQNPFEICISGVSPA